MEIIIYKEDELNNLKKYLFDFDYQESIVDRQLIVIGDVHGRMDRLFSILEGHITTNTFYIVLGDSGLFNNKIIEYYDMISIWDKINNLLKTNNSKLFFGRGNHDNPQYFKCPSPTIFEKYDYIFSLPDHSVLKFKNEFLFWIGGGISIDRSTRTVGYTYFVDELTDFDFKLFKEIEKKYKPQIILSHGLPAEAHPNTLNDVVLQYCNLDRNLKRDLEKERNNYTKLLQIFKHATKWYSGHYHTSIGTTLHYNKEPIVCQNIAILEFKEIYI